MSKIAILHAEAVCVLCPHCAEAQPNKVNGSLLWKREDFTDDVAKACCVSCGEQMAIVHKAKAVFP